MAKPKLALIPATIGDKVYSILPSNGVGDFNFTRGSEATRINAQGLIERVASGENRLNYSLLDGKVVGCPSLLLEPQRTNLIPYSEDFSQWGLDGGTQSVTPNYAVSPDGTQNAYRLQLDKTGGSYSRIYIDAGTIGEKTSSIWIKSNNNSTQNVGLRYDAVGVNLEITSVWKRFELTATSGTVSRFQVILLDSITGNDESCDIQIYGAQLEEGSYATSYIPTNGSAVTRVAETCSGSGDVDTFNDSEGVLMVETKVLDISTSNSWISISEDVNINNNQFNLRFIADSNLIQAVSRAGGLGQDVVLQYTLTDKTLTNKISIKYKLNDWALWVNGFEVDAETSSNAFTPNSLDVLDFDRGNNSSHFYGNTKQIQYFDTVLSDTELEQLTSWDSFRDMAQAQLYSIQ